MLKAATDVEIDAHVVHRTLPATDIAVLELAAIDGRELPAWSPGAHIDLILPIGIERQYSLCGNPLDRHTWQIAVLREPAGRGGSVHVYVYDTLLPGAPVRIRGPRNHFALVPSPRYRFLVGGIGITPILAMITAAESAGAHWTLDYAGRSLDSMPFAAGLSAQFGTRVRLYPGNRGDRMVLADLLAQPAPDTLLYACGPTRMLAEIERLSAGWPHGTLHLEHFVPVPPNRPASTGSFEVELADSGLTLTVPADQSVLDVIEAAGVLVLSSCREGTCGTCETAVLEGVVDHRDSVLTPDEQATNTVMMVCCSRSAGPRLVLDL